MRTKIVLGVTVVAALLMQGCGRKAPLTLPAPKAKAALAEAASQTPVPQKTIELNPQQIKEP